MDITDIENEMRVGQIGLERAQQLLVRLSAEYSYTAGILEKIAETKPAKWLTMRREFKSDASTDRAWEATPYGTTEATMNIKLKRIGKLIGATKTLIELAHGQTRTNY